MKLIDVLANYLSHCDPIPDMIRQPAAIPSFL
jgi:hypothetical protein